MLTGPESGGDTLWSSGYSLYLSLSPGLQTYLKSLSAMHSAVDVAQSARAMGSPICRELIETAHPVVRVHPATGWKSVYVNPGEATLLVFTFFRSVATLNIETTAHQQDDGSYVLNTPTEEATKFMPALNPTFGVNKIALIMARLIIKGEDRGMRPRAFIEPLPPSLSPSPVPPPSPANITPDQTPCPPCPSLLQSGLGIGSSRSASDGVPIANTSTALSRLAKPINATVQLLPLLSTPSPEDIKEPIHDDAACLEAELSHLWQRQSSLIDAEAEMESEAESSVVHTEAESNGESTRSMAAFNRVTKANHTSVQG
ncbi:hypothetical protein EI94DRAFT_1809182 [Lactarius quietus]|nr:hypothetical protein EI94DRAFT_1809182 [Lactarius quietus]